MRVTTLSTFAALVMCLSIPAQRAAAQDKPQEKPVETVELVLHPMGESRPALKHRLTFNWLERSQQNAAPLYLKTYLHLQERGKQDDVDQIAKWLDETPLDKLPIDDVRKLLSPYESGLADIDVASRRDRCDWELPIREQGADLFAMLLPEAQQARNAARLLALRARLQLAEGKREEALGTVRTLLAFSQHVSEEPFLICGLVGMAMASLGVHELEMFVQQKDAPNLYWALTELPDPLVSLQAGIELEYVAVYLVLPELAEARTGEHTAEEWERLAERLVGRLQPLIGVTDLEAESWKRLREAGRIENGYEPAKARLLARGHDAKRVEAMAKGHVLLLDAAESFDEVRDELYKAFSLPYPDSEKIIAQSNAVIAKAPEMGAGGQLAALLLPAINSVNRAVARTQRNVDGLRIVEAIRLHAAAHGELPASLEAITLVPIPENALTGRPFGYRREGAAAILDLEDTQSPRQYRLRLAE